MGQAGVSPTGQGSDDPCGCPEMHIARLGMNFQAMNCMKKPPPKLLIIFGIPAITLAIAFFYYHGFVRENFCLSREEFLDVKVVDPSKHGCDEFVRFQIDYFSQNNKDGKFLENRIIV